MLSQKYQGTGGGSGRGTIWQVFASHNIILLLRVFLGFFEPEVWVSDGHGYLTASGYFYLRFSSAQIFWIQILPCHIYGSRTLQSGR